MKKSHTSVTQPFTRISFTNATNLHLGIDYYGHSTFTSVSITVGTQWITMGNLLLWALTEVKIE